jgi:hypothetical protein
MITIKNIEKAMRMITNLSEYLNCEAVEKRLAWALEIYEARGEYLGDLDSAIECLQLAEYEIEGLTNN